MVISASPCSSPSRWLLLRGLGREARHWFDFPARLSQALGVPVVARDLPGVGTRADGIVPLTIEGMARDLASFTGARSSDGPWGVCGISLGAMVALALAAIQPISVSHLVVINGSSRLSSPFERLAPHALRTLIQAARVADGVARERLIHSLVTNGDEAQLTTWATRAAQLREGEAVRVAPVIRQLLAALSFEARPVSQPTLVLYGGADRMVAPSCSQRLAHHLGASFAVHPTAGHDLPLEQPAWVVAQIAEWLRVSATPPSS